MWKVRMIRSLADRTFQLSLPPLAVPSWVAKICQMVASFGGLLSAVSNQFVYKWIFVTSMHDFFRGEARSEDLHDLHTFAPPQKLLLLEIFDETQPSAQERGLAHCSSSPSTQSRGSMVLMYLTHLSWPVGLLSEYKKSKRFLNPRLEFWMRSGTP